MSKPFLSIFPGTSSVTEVDKSIFCCHLAMTPTVKEADAFIRQMKKEHKGCTNASAYIVGRSGEEQRARDNGEPGGTAGQPILTALKQAGVTNTTAVVSRKFGGKLLGANRLKKYYGGACKKAIRELGLAEWRLNKECELTVPYHFEGSASHELKACPWLNVQEPTYTETVTYVLQLQEEDLPRFEGWIQDLTHGQAQIKILGECYVPYPPKEE